MTGRLFRHVMRFLSDPRGGVSAMLTLMLIPMIGVFGMGAEASSWYLVQRAAQNAADSSAMAAASNGCGIASDCVGSQTYDFEAKSVATKLGFTDGASNTTVVASNTATCPNGDTNCYSVTITRLVPIYLTRVVGFNGDADLGGGRAQTVKAVSIARPKGKGVGYCVTAKGTAANSIEFKGGGGGGADIDFGGCDFRSNGGASCTNKVGTTTNIGFSDVLDTGDAKNCGTERAVVPAVLFADPYAGRASNIPDPVAACSGNYPQATKKDGVTVAANKLSGPQVFSITSPKCGDVVLTGNVTVTADSVLLINNGQLDLGTYKLSADSGVRLTIIFSGTSGAYGHTIVGTGTLDYSAPKSGTWSGMAIYQNPALTTGVNLIYSGNSPAFNLTGMVYAPESTVDISGSINHATAGDACLAFFVKNLHSNGTIAMFAKPTRECDRAGLELPGVPGTESRQALVQ